MKKQITHALFIGAMILTGSTHCMMDISNLPYLPTEQPNNYELNEMRKKITEAKEEKITEVCPFIECIKIEKPGQRKGICFHYAMKRSLQLPKEQFASLKIIGCSDWIENLNILNFYEQTNTPQTNTLAVYTQGLKIEHFGVVNHNSTIRSKFGLWREIYNHPLWCVPLFYGDTVTFLNLKKRYHGSKGKQLLFDELSKKIDADKELQRELNTHQQTFLKIATEETSGTYFTAKTYELLKKGMGIKVDYRTTENETALMLAAKKGHLNLVFLYVIHGANVNLQDDHGNTALHRAANNNHSKIVEFLLANGANPHITNNQGEKANISFTILYRTPLQYGAAIGLGALLGYAIYKGIFNDDNALVAKNS